MAASDARRGEATKHDTGKSCPFCRFPIKERDEIMTCRDCDSPHHADCWEENGGCANPACISQREEEPRPAQGRPSRSGSHLPPKAGPSAKKQRITIDPEPNPRKSRPRPARPRRESPKQSEPRSRTPYWVVGGIVGLVALFGLILVISNFGDRGSFNERNCEPGTGKDGVPCYDNGLLPNKKRAVLKQEVGQFLRNWYRDIGMTQWGTAWDAMSGTAREWYNNHGGFRRFKRDYADISRYLNVTNARIQIKEPSYPNKGVLTVFMTNMPWTDDGASCNWRQGVTWVKWNPKEKHWMYDPGYWTSTKRQQDWGSQQEKILKSEC